MPGPVYTEFFILLALVGRNGSSTTVNLRVCRSQPRRAGTKSALFIILFEVTIVPMCSAVPGVIYASTCDALMLRLLQVVSVCGVRIARNHKRW